MTVDKNKAAIQRKKQFDYINQYARDNYDRINIHLPKGTKELIKAKYPGKSINGYIKELIFNDLDK